MSDLESLVEYDEIINKKFASEEEGFRFYNSYGFDKGFSVRRSYCPWDNGHKEMTLRRFVCRCEGFREEKHLNRTDRKRKPRNITRFGCPAKFEISRDQNTGQWFVKEFIDGHNHPMAPPELICLLRSHRRISDDQKADIVEMEIAGIRKHQIFDILETQYGGYDKVGFTTRDLYNFCHRNKSKTIADSDAQTVLSHLAELKHRDPDFFFKHMVDGEGHLQGLFWCDSQCLLDYDIFGDVVVFDSTYKTNRYNLPLVLFVGVNHHRSTIIFGCGVISHENIASYVWLLRAFSEAMIQKHPVSVITDGDLAMQRAIRHVWHNSSHRLCVWHIEQNIVRNLHDDVVKEEIRRFLYDACPIEENEKKWTDFLDKHKVRNKESWLYQMYDMREIWCATYHATKCYLGLRSNQRSESMNAKVHLKLDHKMTLFDLVQHCDHCISGLRRNEAMLDCEALQSKPAIDPHSTIIEKHAGESFTPTVFGIVQFSIKAALKCYVIEMQHSRATTSILGHATIAPATVIPGLRE